MKKVITFVMIFIMCFCPTVWAEGVTVNITVTDITDWENPLNTLVERRAITVSESDLNSFNETMAEIEAVPGITYLHALVELHRELYGEDAGNMLMITAEGETKYFMGRSVANVMYKNGRDIFDLPQNVNIQNGDEIQVCLYDEGHSQAVATFNEALIDNVSVGESVQLRLEQYYGSPRDRDPIEGAEITDGNGIYLSDQYGNIITTDTDGRFNIKFDEPGTYTVSAMPEINYYITDTGGGTKIEYVPVTKIEVVEEQVFVTGAKNGGEASQIFIDWLIDIGYCSSDEPIATIVFDWDDDSEIETEMSWNDAFAEANGVGTWETRLVEKEITTLEPVEVITTDETTPMITYTTPLVTINVTDKLIITDVTMTEGGVRVDMKNNSRYIGDDIYIAGFNGNRLMEVKTTDISKGSALVAIGTGYEAYKVMAWKDKTMEPLTAAFTYIPQ